MNQPLLFSGLVIVIAAIIWFIQWWAFDYMPRKHLCDAMRDVQRRQRMDQLVRDMQSPRDKP